MHGGDEYFVGAVLKLLISGNLKLAHAALNVAFILLLDGFEKIGLRFFGRKTGDFLQFYLFGLAQFVELCLRGGKFFIFLHQVLLFEVEVGLALVEELFFAHQTLLHLLEVGGATLELVGDAVFGRLGASLRFFGDFLRTLFGVELHLADLEFHRAALTQRNNKSEKVSDCYACDARKGEKQEDGF